MITLVPESSTGIFPSPLIGKNSQWEAENPNFLVIWPGIQWAWSKICDTSPCPLICQNSQWEAKILTSLLVDLQTSMRGQNGVKFYQESTGRVRFILALLLADQWEAENPNFLLIWPTDKYEGSKWGRIWPGIHWSCWIFASPLIGRPMRGWKC